MNLSDFKVSSFVQMRGSIPFYWENQNIKSLKPTFYYFSNLNEGFDSTVNHFKNLG